MSDLSTLPALPVQEGVEFRLVPNFFGYCVGDDGSVWTCWKPGRWSTMFDSWKRVKTPPHFMSNGRIRGLQLNLRRPGGGLRHVYVHTVVLMAFVGPRPDGMEGCHENGDPTDNRQSNLRWGTRKENAEDMVRHGRSMRGSRSPIALLTEQDIPAIRFLLSLGWTRREIGEVFGVHRRTITSVAIGESWVHVE